jgi:tetratricopeptide (TPR) repeat protein
MSIYNKRYFFLMLFFFTAISHISFAQKLEIAGDTIYVNAEAEVMLRFPKLPTFFNTIPSNAPYNFKTASTGFTIIAKQEKTKPAPLLVTEGGRDHKFLLVFKKNINYNNDAEMDYDYSTTKKLEEHIKNVLTGKSSENQKTELPKGKKKKNEEKTEDLSRNYYVLLEEGDLNLKNKNLVTAKKMFEDAQKIRPDDQIPKQRLEEIRIILSDQAKSKDAEKNKQYVDIITVAQKNFNSKKYQLAQEGYQNALIIKPADIYATRQLEIISKLIKNEDSKEELLKLANVYKNYISTGDNALKSNKFSDARIAYEQALIIKPNDAFATDKLKLVIDKEKKQKDNETIESDYTSTIALADKLYKAGDYDEAKLEYNKALTINKKPWPQEQIKAINKLQAALLAKEATDEKNSKKRLEIEQKQKEKEDIVRNYNETIKAADKYFMAKDYASASLAYTKALKIDEKPWPQEQLKNIEKIKDKGEEDRKKVVAAEETAKQIKERKKIEEKEKQARNKLYKNTIEDADKLFSKKDYANAKDAYVKASTYSTEKWPQDQIVLIEKLIDAQIAQEKVEKARLLKEAELTAQYTSLVEKANSEFSKGNYTKAQKLYTGALTIKPSENLPKEKIAEIENKIAEIATAEKAKKERLAAAKALEEKYVLLIAKAKLYFVKEDFVNAKEYYTEAKALKPNADEPIAQLKIIQTKLEEIAKANEVNDRYYEKISIADNLLISKQYENALASYKDALKIKEGDYYAQAQLNYLNKAIKTEQKDKEDREKLEAYKKEEEKENKYFEALKRADLAVAEKNYALAKTSYIEALAIHSDNTYAQQRLRIVNYQLEKEKTEVAVAKEPKEEKSKGNKKADKDEVKFNANQAPDSIFFSKTPTPYSLEELKAKHPNIDFTNLQPDQPFNKEEFNLQEKRTFLKKVFAQSPRLDLSNTDKKIKLTCLGLNFEDEYVYMKLLVKNNSSADFFTGNMMATWTRKIGTRIKIYPVYIYPAFLPIITPGKEAVLIYVAKSYYVDDSEKIDFELQDRLNQVKLEVKITGKKYNEELNK